MTDEIEVIYNNVDTSKAGVYQVTYKVTDSQGATTTRTITVTVEERKVEIPTSDNNSGKVVAEKVPVKDTSTSPKTDDNNYLMGYGIILILSIIGIGITVSLKHKRQD